MIGIQGETALEEVTKSPADAALSTTSTNSVQNKVITKEINEIKDSLGQKSSTSVAGDDAFSKIDTLRAHKYDVYSTSDTTTGDIKVALSNKWNSLTTGMWVIRTSVYTYNCFIYKHDGGNSYGTALVMSYTGSLLFATRQNNSMNWYTITTKLVN